ncbi:hypothetical protein PNQ92_09315 [Halobacterium salinarum]|uniref:hypothetical protein n=1 Tax=Halobacterium salinarum TaxID=2242 RepID=UPI0025538AEB|nr:hypothetical protein [Halobacterium salinarum]MDL0125606.1 hypothetical protein [Halobacterium salinarum]
MSMAITHFAIGGTLTALAALYLLPPTRYARTLVLFGGVWGMLPDIHWVTPVYAAEIKALHSSVFANVFWLHETLDVLDPTDSRLVGALSLAVFLVTVSLGDHWAYTTRERAADSPAAGWPIEPLRSLTILTRIAGITGVVLGLTFLAAGLTLPAIGSLQGLYFGIGMALLGSGVVAVGGRLATANWVARRIPRLIRSGMWTTLSTALVLVGVALVAIPARSSVTADTVAFAGLGSTLMLAGLLVAQLRLHTTPRVQSDIHP